MQAGCIIIATGLEFMPKARAVELEERFKISQWLVDTPKDGTS